MANGNGVTQAWWMDVLRREGILTVLVLVWVFACAIPESQDRRAALTDMRQTNAVLVSCAMETKEFQATIADFQHAVTREHSAFHEQQVALLSAHQKLLILLDTKLGGGG